MQRSTSIFSILLRKNITLTHVKRSFASVAEHREPNPDGPKLGPLRSAKIPLQEGETRVICTCGLTQNQVCTFFRTFAQSRLIKVDECFTIV